MDQLWQQLLAGGGGSLVGGAIAYLIIQKLIPRLTSTFEGALNRVVQANQEDRKADRKMLRDAIDRIPCIGPTRKPTDADTAEHARVKAAPLSRGEPDSDD